MGKASRIKKEKQAKAVTSVNKPPLMEMKLVEAYERGRNVGIKEGKAEGIAEIMMKYHNWAEEIDKHVKGIGPATKLAIIQYFAERIQESIEKNKSKKQ
jgi:hypothetical protein